MALIQYITDENGNQKAVVVSLDEWQRISKLAEEAQAWKETVYLLQSDTMRKRLLEARQEKKTFTLEEVREKLGI